MLAHDLVLPLSYALLLFVELDVVLAGTVSYPEENTRRIEELLLDPAPTTFNPNDRC